MHPGASKGHQLYALYEIVQNEYTGLLARTSYGQGRHSGYQESALPEA